MKKISILYSISLMILPLHYAEASSLANDNTATKHTVIHTVAAKGGSQAQPLTRTATTHPEQWLFASEQRGLLLQRLKANHDTAPEVLLEGEFELLSLLAPYALTLDRKADRVQPIKLKQVEGKTIAQRLPLLPMLPFEIQWICSQVRPQDGNLYAWFGGENGQSQQWLLGNATHWAPQLLRSQAIPVNSRDCAIDGDTLYVSEPQAGIWQFDASPFADGSGTLFQVALDNHITGLAVVNGQLLLADDTGVVRVSQTSASSAAKPNDSTQSQPLVQFSGANAEKLSYTLHGDSSTAPTITWAIYDDHTDEYKFASTSTLALSQQENAPAAAQITEIPAWVESAPSDRPHDTMDDPAIWVHPTTPEKSLILGTHKRWGLLSFSMQGEQVQALPSGRINNVDIRQQVLLGGIKRDIAVATLRDNDSLAFYDIDSTGKIHEYPNQATDLQDIYGMCLYQDGAKLYVFANEKSGRIAQYRVDWHNDAPRITLVRNIHSPSQVEGCVADESQHTLFVGEEDQGIWRFDAQENANTQGTLIIKAEGDLVADVEGIALYQGAQINGKKQDVLVVSSQGNNSYILYQARPPYAQIGRFRIGVNLQGMENGRASSIDGSAETDGLAVTHLPVGQGDWQQGMLVVQDGHNYLPDANQAFKWLPWRSIAQQLQLN